MRIPSLRAPVAVVLCLLMVACSGQTAGNGSVQGNGANPSAEGGGRGRGGRGGAGGGPVPVVTAKVQSRSVAVTIPAVGTAEPISAVQIRSQVTGQLSAIHFAEGQDVAQRASRSSRWTRGRSRRRCSRPRRCSLATRRRPERRSPADALRGSVQARPDPARPVRDAARQRWRRCRRRSRPTRRAIETARLNLQFTPHHRADLRAHRRARRARRRSRPGQRHHSARGDQSACRRSTSRSRSPAGIWRTSAATRRSRPLAWRPADAGAERATTGGAGGTPATRPARRDVVSPGSGAVSFIDNAVDPTTGTIRSRARSPTPTTSSGPGLRAGDARADHDESDAIVVPATAVQASQDGQYVYVVKPDRPWSCRTVTGRTAAGRRGGHRARASRGRGSGDRRSAPAHAGRARDDRSGW